MGLEAVALETEEDEVRGVNTQAQLAEAEAVLQRRLRAAALTPGSPWSRPKPCISAPTPSSAAMW